MIFPDPKDESYYDPAKRFVEENTSSGLAIYANCRFGITGVLYSMGLEALVVGYEVSIRSGRCWHDLHEVYQSCGSWGSLGCAAAVAHLLKLDLTQISNALGIAEYHSPNAPMMRDIYNPTMVKHAISWGAMNGVTSALLAQKGYTGMASLLGMEKYAEWVSDLGDVYWMADWVFHKEWASCAWGHAAGVA
jgi:2-methylcitrate dehydratase PrpD